MYCPKCGMKVDQGINFCRTCGTDVRLVSAALTGTLTPAETNHQLERPTSGEQYLSDSKLISRGVQEMSIGAAFLTISICVMLFAPAGRLWWFWMLIPAFTLLGKGIASFVELKHRSRYFAAAPPPVAAPAPEPTLDEGRQYELSPPPSVTETTTRHLDYDAPRREPER